MCSPVSLHSLYIYVYHAILQVKLDKFHNPAHLDYTLSISKLLQYTKTLYLQDNPVNRHMTTEKTSMSRYQ